MLFGPRNSFVEVDRAGLLYEMAKNSSWPVKVINVGSDTFGNPIFQKGLQN